jgi:hypothetical protein
MAFAKEIARPKADTWARNPKPSLVAAMSIDAEPHGEAMRNRQPRLRSPLPFALGLALLCAAVVASVLPMISVAGATLVESLTVQGLGIAGAAFVVLSAGAIAWLWWRNLTLRAELRDLADHAAYDDRVWYADLPTHQAGDLGATETGNAPLRGARHRHRPARR